MTDRARIGDTQELEAELEALKAEIQQLRAALSDAIECVQSWGDYASEYFQDKHDLQGDIARLELALRTGRSNTA